MKTATFAFLFLAAPVWAAPSLLLFPAVGSPRRVIVYGRAQAKGQGESHHKLTRNLKSLTAHNAEGVPVTVTFSGLTANVTSGHDGNFEATFDAPADGGFPVGSTSYSAKSGEATASAGVEIASEQAPFFVVSDFDDTVAVTNVLDKKGLVKAALLQDETTQPVVPGMSDFYRCLRAVKAEAPVFALVSGSPVQYEPRIRGFLSRNGFGPFGLYLRDLGPNTLERYKQPVIRKLLQSMPHPVVLVGDSGEADPEVYKEIAGEFPGRVRAIYIRDAGRSSDAARFKDMVLFKDAAAAASDAVGKGLAQKACVEKAFAKVSP
jgi:phosphatidate phosphatase APP1